MSSEEKSLIPVDLLPKTQDDDAISALTRTSEFLPQIRIYGSQASVVQEQKFPMGHFGLYFSAENIVDLGEQFNCLVCHFRPRASIILGDAPINFYGRFDGSRWIFAEQFDIIKDKAMSKERGYFAGLEYLVWIPHDINKFALFYMGSITLRRESPNIKALVGKAATLKIKFIKTKEYSWHGCSTFPCSTPFDIPDKDSIMEEIAKFCEPQDSNVEFADDNAEESRAR